MSRHLVFCTYELYPVNRGGCGVLVDALARQLATAGHTVTVLGDMPQGELDAWARWAVEQGVPAERLNVVRLETLAELEPRASIFEAKSLQFARGLRALYAKSPFDLVEMHEYAGVAWEAVRRHQRDGWFALARLVVRIHGSLELIDLQEAPDTNAERSAMYLMERFAMRGADAVLAPSLSMADEYAALYELDRSRLQVCAPPMDLLLPRWEPKPPNAESRDLLVFGKLQEIKGCDLVAEAAASLFEAEPGLPGRIVFVGADAPCARHGRPTSECVKSFIPEALQHRFEFRAHISRENLPELVAGMRAGIVASKFESFCLAAHELRSLDLPLVISDRPAFRDYFNKDNAFLFDGSVASLRLAIRAALTDDDKVARLRAAGPVSYTEAPPVYARLLADSPGSPLPRALTLTDFEIERLHLAHARDVEREQARQRTTFAKLRNVVSSIGHRIDPFATPAPRRRGA